MEVGPRVREERPEGGGEQRKLCNYDVEFFGLVVVEFCHGFLALCVSAVGGKQSGDTCSEMLNS